jgi:type IV secretion system protein VirB10
MVRSTHSDGFDNEPQAFEPADNESVVEVHSPFNAEVKKRRNTRALVAGALLLVLLIGGLAIGGVVLQGYRERWASERAEKEKASKERMAMSRHGREFKLEERPAEPPATAAIPTAAGASASQAIPLKDPGKPSPTTSPPAAQKPPPPPPMMMANTGGSGANEASAEAQAKAPSPRAHAGRVSVQEFANRETADKAPTASNQSMASNLGDRAFVIARGSWIPCILETQLDTTVPGNTSCVIPEDVYSDDGRQVLIGKGSKAMGSFGNSLRQGDNRIAVTWSRVKTTTGVVIDVDSPATDGVGTTGAGGYVENHWMERIGAAVLLSFVQDAVAYALTVEQQKNSGVGGTNVYVPQNTQSQTTRLAEKILDSTINIAPTLYKNRGDRVMIFVNRDLWFDSTYQLVKAD